MSHLSYTNKLIRLLITSLILFIPLTVSGFYITVKNTDGEPVEDALIILNDKIFNTNEKGKLYFETIPDSVRIIKMGYESIYIKPVPEIIILDRKVYTGASINVTDEKSKQAFIDKGEAKSIVLSDKDRIENNIEALLEKSAGITITGSKFTDGGEQKVSLKGKSAKHTLILLDGVPLNKSGQAFDLSSIPLNIVESIDILEGNSTYSSGSAGGIISINTRSKSFINTSSVVFASGVGSYENYSETIQISNSNNYLSSDFSIVYESAENDYEYENLQGFKLDRQNNDLEKLSLSGVLKLTKIGITAFHEEYDRGAPGTITNVSMFNKCRLSGHNGSYMLSYQDIYKGLSIGVSYLFSEQYSRYNNLESSVITKRNMTKEISRKNDIRFSTVVNLGKFKFEQISNYTNEYYNQKKLDNPLNQISNSSTMQNIGDYINITRWDSVGVYLIKTSGSIKGEVSSINEFNNDNRYFNYSGRIEIGREFSGSLKIDTGVDYGQAYTVPSFYELFWKGDSRVQGNPNLKEEKLTGFNVFTKLSTDLTELKVDYHKSCLEDMIFWYKSLIFWTTGNIDDAEYEVWSVDFSQKFFHYFTANLNWKRNSAINVTEGSDHYGKHIPSIFSSETKIDLGFRNNFVESDVTWVRYGRQWKYRDNLNGVIKPYELLNASIRLLKDFSKKYNLSLYLDADNILSREYEIQSHEPQPGITFTGGVSLKVTF